ncbi:hypothetical protein KA012_04575 [Candidatus Woesebacteria bacterium]|nr:hypothetical protein [Candidatus Woesebacteria bacterium]
MMNIDTKQLPEYLHIFMLSVAILGAYIWLQLPALQPHSLQGFALAILVFFGLKFFSKYRHHEMSGIATYELIPLVFALILLIGATGAGQSSYFALLYIFLLLLVLTSSITTSIVITGELTFFLYALSIQLDSGDWRQLLSLPLMLGFFLYIKYQLAISTQQKQQLATSTSAFETVAEQKLTLEKFVGEFLKPKLSALASLGKNQQTTKQVLLSQLDLLENEIDKVLSRPTQITPTLPVSDEAIEQTQ